MINDMINRNWFLLLILFAAVLFSDCGGSGGAAESNGNNAVNVNPGGNKNNEVINPPAPPPVNANINGSTLNPGAGNTTNLSSNKPDKKDLPRGGKITPATYPAPDNSEISTTLGENLMRTRVFLNNAQMVKIEETTIINENNRTILKVYLRNGQVKEIPAGQITDPMSESAANILKIVEAQK